jgi:hypothetical protein
MESGLPASLIISTSERISPLTSTLRSPKAPLRRWTPFVIVPATDAATSRLAMKMMSVEEETLATQTTPVAVTPVDVTTFTRPGRSVAFTVIEYVSPGSHSDVALFPSTLEET